MNPLFRAFITLSLLAIVSAAATLPPQCRNRTDIPGLFSPNISGAAASLPADVILCLRDATHLFVTSSQYVDEELLEFVALDFFASMSSLNHSEYAFTWRASNSQQFTLGTVTISTEEEIDQVSGHYHVSSGSYSESFTSRNETMSFISAARNGFRLLSMTESSQGNGKVVLISRKCDDDACSMCQF